MERNRVVPKSDHLLYTKCAQVGRGRVGDTSVHRWGGAGGGTQRLLVILCESGS